MAKVERVESEDVYADTPDANAPGVVKIEATSKKLGDRKVTVLKNFGADLAEMVELFGEKVVHSFARRLMIIRVQAICRSQAEGSDKVPGKSDEEIQTFINTWKPGELTTRGTSKVAKAEKLIAEAEMDDAEIDTLEALLAQKKAQKAAA